MPEIATDPPAPSGYLLFPRPAIEESQQLGPDPFLPRARAFRQGKLRQSARPAARIFGFDARVVDSLYLATGRGVGMAEALRGAGSAPRHGVPEGHAMNLTKDLGRPKFQQRS
jgi:hypothetical protein